MSCSPSSGAGKDVRQLQLIITGQKGVILDLEKEGQDAQALSKELYIWGHSETSDIKDVTDRLAYLTFIQGSLATSLAASIDASRAPLKALRDAEAQLQPRRSIRNNYELQISRLKNEGKPGVGGKIRELETLLSRAEDQDDPLEKEIELLKRKAIVESETQRWSAIKEVSLHFLVGLSFLSDAIAVILLVWRKACPSCTSFQAYIERLA